MANTIKQLASFAVLNVNGGDRVSYTYDEINAETGDMVSSNNKGNFFCVDTKLKKEIDDIRKYLQDNKLNISEEA